MGFRIHRSVLAMKSGVFRDMFSLPQPEVDNASRQTDDCPVIRLSDSPEDLAYFFDAMYNGMRYRFDNSSQPTWAALKALLILGNKYDADELYKEALRCLSLQFPKDIKAWDALYQNSWFILGKEDVLAIEIANTCRLLQLAEFHVLALYLCCVLPKGTLEEGAYLQRGKDAKVQLNPEDVAVCLAVKSTLRKALRKNMKMLVVNVPSQSGSQCLDEGVCSTTVGQLRKRKDCWPRGLASKPYSVLDPFRGVFSDLIFICRNCEGWLHEEYADIRQRVRNELHKYIVVPPY
ncbi:hypothetical protein PHLGIDRAFT_20388 [Phlebiopsis gigantea 11061_1 CR5-6]|uniref:BTB domain-containing protein n=1 Tax=Phlebiopsis gigantea (strain 11061_1 CR5-6) TaxID=745531 RepID=A0A0C3PCK5_PHLG1|nr:hypothetical protein PHLGIDRAFT_20388 [Phlebiopsis gigantea 11061_1 CR5-6]